MDYEKLLNLVYEVATDLSKKGPGWAQQAAVLAEVSKKVPNSADVRMQQQILTCWHDLFREGKLSWGYDLDNVEAPFFHLPDRQPRRSKSA
jgi:hypothetical protein